MAQSSRLVKICTLKRCDIFSLEERLYMIVEGSDEVQCEDRLADPIDLIPVNFGDIHAVDLSAGLVFTFVRDVLVRKVRRGAIL